MQKNDALALISTYVGFAIKSGAAVFGMEKTAAERHPDVILADFALSDKSKKEIRYIADKRRAPLIFLDGLDGIVKRANVKIVSINNKNLAIQICEVSKGLSEVKEHE
ncbi:MAG: hypothetical protein LBQ40_06710 [Clostridiales bacterium]|jgi:hypothetical protein|nr:hypothetical protein [Clostridiales bacterium]